MASKLAFFIFAVSGVIVNRIAGQDGCRPDIVINIRLYDDLLTWDDSPFETCETNFYMVTIVGIESDIEQVLQVTERMLDVTFLPPCEEYIFTVTKISTDNVQGGNSMSHYGTTSPPPEADLSLQFLRLSQMSGWVQLEWAVEEQWEPCATRYRILIYDEDRNVPQDYYTSYTHTNLTYLTPCTPYTFAVTAVFNLEDEGPPKAIRHRTIEVVPSDPIPVHLDISSTSVAMTWRVGDDFILNRCHVTSININATPNFAVSYPVRDDPDNRQPFTVTLPGLTPDTMYYLNVTFTNAAGSSPGILLFLQTPESN